MRFKIVYQCPEEPNKVFERRIMKALNSERFYKVRAYDVLTGERDIVFEDEPRHNRCPNCGNIKGG